MTADDGSGSESDERQARHQVAERICEALIRAFPDGHVQGADERHAVSPRVFVSVGGFRYEVRVMLRSVKH